MSSAPAMPPPPAAPVSRAGRILLSVVVPCYNEEEVIGLTHERLLAALGGDSGFELEIVYVNDGSRDRTEALVNDLAARDRRVKAVSFTRNFGHQAAVSAGLKYASGDVVAVIDADLQDPPEVVGAMLAKWRQGYDVVYGVREKRKEHLGKRLAYALFYRVYRFLASIEVPLDSGDFSLMGRRVVDVMNSLPEKNRFVRGLRSWSGFAQTGIAYERSPRAAGEPKYGLLKLARLAFDGIVNFSTAPLTLIFWLGVTTAALALLAAVLYLGARILDVPIFGHAPGEAPGFTTLILTVLFLGGVQLISVGILGQYLGRIYEETKMRPTFLVKGVRGGAPRPPDSRGAE